MVKKSIVFTYIMFLGFSSFSQKLDIGIFYGRFYGVYNYKDYGTGFRNLPGSQYNPFPSIVLNKKYSSKISGELRLSFIPFVQYTGTRLYTPGFYSNFNNGNISATINYSFSETRKSELRIKGGIGLGLSPDGYEGTFIEMHVFPYIDSISRGDIKRNFSPIYPTVSTGLDFS